MEVWIGLFVRSWIWREREIETIRTVIGTNVWYVSDHILFEHLFEDIARVFVPEFVLHWRLLPLLSDSLPVRHILWQQWIEVVVSHTIDGDVGLRFRLSIVANRFGYSNVDLVSQFVFWFGQRFWQMIYSRRLLVYGTTSVKVLVVVVQRRRFVEVRQRSVVANPGPTHRIEGSVFSGSAQTELSQVYAPVKQLKDKGWRLREAIIFGTLSVPIKSK